MNSTNLKKIIEYIFKYRDDKSKIPQILIIGKADPKPIGESSLYSSNRELSKARIENAQYELLEGLSKINYPSLIDIVWQDRPVSPNNNITVFNRNKDDRDKQCQPIGPKETDPYSNQRVVEVKVKFRKEKADSKPEPLKVLDYMYFSLYTITTTGYGDIKPLTPLAKFICSLENIIEVFFLVIFVNVLIAFKDSKAMNEIKSMVENELKSMVENELKPIKDELGISSTADTEKKQSGTVNDSNET